MTGTSADNVVAIQPKKGNFVCTMEEDSVSVENNGKIYQVDIDCRAFTREDMSIKISPTIITVEGKHETEEESTEFYEEYIIPPGVSPATIQVSMNDNGVLRLQAPVKAGSKEPSTKSESSSKETTQTESCKTTTVRSEVQESEQMVGIETEGSLDAETIAKHEDVSKEIKSTQDKFQLQLNVSEYRSEEIRIRTSQKTVTITAVKKEKTTSTRALCKRFTIPDGADPKSLTGTIDPKTGTLTLTCKRTLTDTKVSQKQETVVQQSRESVKQHQPEPAIQPRPSPEAPGPGSVNTVTRSDQELIDDSAVVRLQETIIETEDGTEVQVDLKVPATYKPQNIKVTVYKNVITITGRSETTTMVRTFYKRVPIAAAGTAQDTTANLSPEGVLIITTLLAKTKTVEQSTKVKQTREQQQQQKQVTTTQTRQEQQQKQVTTTETTQEQQQKQQVTSTKTTQQQQVSNQEQPTRIQPKVTNEVVAKDTNAEDITNEVLRHVAEGKTFHVELNVSSYKAEEIKVTIHQKIVTIRGKQERKEETKSSAQEFYKMFSLPEGVNPEDIQVTITKSGTLTITSTETKSLTKKSVRRSGTTEDVVKINPKICKDDSKTTVATIAQSETGMQMQSADNFERKIEAFGYKPSEIEVKIENGWVVIRGKQGMTQENNFRSREFTKKFTLPAGLKPEDVTSALSPEGILTVTRRR